MSDEESEVGRTGNIFLTFLFVSGLTGVATSAVVRTFTAAPPHIVIMSGLILGLVAGFFAARSSMVRQLVAGLLDIGSWLS